MGKYRVLGALLDRVFRNNLNANFDEVDVDIQAQKQRVDNLIVSNPQPSEVVDSRGGFPILKDRLDDTDEQMAKKATKHWVNILDYGAKGDGTTSDSQFIQDAINAGDVIVFPPNKTYLFKNVQVKSNKTLIMYGATLKYGGTQPTPNNRIENQSGLFFVAGTSSVYEENIVLLGGKLIGNKVSTNWLVDDTATGDDIIQASFAKNITFRDMIITEAGQDGIELKTCDYVTVENCRLINIADAGIEVRGNGNYLIQNNHYYMTRNALFCKSHEEYNNTNPKNVVFKDNYCETFFSPVIFHETFNIKIEGNKFFPLQTPDGTINAANNTAISTASPPTLSVINDLRDIKIINNYIDGFTGAKAIQITRQTGTSDVKRVEVKGNIIKNCLMGVTVEGGAIITDNVFEDIVGNSTNDYCIIVNPFNLDTIVIDRNKFVAVNKVINVGSSNILIISNNVSDGQWFANLGVSTNLKIINNYIKAIGQGIYCNGSNDVIIENNTIESTILPVSTEGNNVIVRNNRIKKTGAGAYYSIRIKGQDNVVSGNKITHDGTNPPIEYLSGSSAGIIQRNEVINTGAITSIRTYGNRVSITNNIVRGGNQGIRVYGNECVVSQNIVENAVYQGIHIMSGATKNLVTSNIALNNGTNIGDEGTSTVLANNISA